MRLKETIIILTVICLCSCQKDLESPSFQNDKFKSKLVAHDPEKCGFKFDNILDESILKNPFNYINAYNGGGVAIGDVNNDGLQDIYVTGNMRSSRLFMNKGNWKFEDVSKSAGVLVNGWSTTPVMVDINSDGWLDIYICRSYHDKMEDRSNLLYINNKNGTFTEKAAEYGIDDGNYSITAAFFDYDLDGDLDLVVANHPQYRLLPFQMVYNYWQNPILQFSNRLFKNDGGKFKDVTKEAGLLTYSFTLGLVTTDFNLDGYPDIYFAVDHDEPDIALVNNGDGTFTDITDHAVKQVSRSSMGIDAGDVNHDIYPDLMVAEMLSEDHYREKISMSMQSVDRFQLLIEEYDVNYYQMRNFLHLNNGNSTFSDIAQLAEIHKTDWSWSPLFMDLDNDSWQDVFVSNGYYRDIYNQDSYKKFDSVMLTLGPDMVKKNQIASEYARSCAQPKVHNYIFKNNGDLTFTNLSLISGMDKKTISTGAAYGDLDNDGDLDLVVNNLGEPSTIYENKTSAENHYLRIGFKTNKGVVNAGAKVILESNDEIQYREFITTRGYQASCEPFIHFGLGEQQTVDKVKVVWLDGKMLSMENVKADQLITVDYEDASESFVKPENEHIVEEVNASSFGLEHKHVENKYDDYKDQILLPHKMSEQGPNIQVADIDNNGESDLFIGSAEGMPSVLYKQVNGKFIKSNTTLFQKDSGFEDGKATFFDADNDGDQDLFVSSAGYEYPIGSPQYQPRLYLNDGKGNFIRSSTSLPNLRYSSSCVKAADFDGDGDMDLFLGGRLHPKSYPMPGRSSLLINNGRGIFSDETATICADLENIGMVQDAVWTDVNRDEKLDLIVVGEWMPISVFVQSEGKLVEKTDEFFKTPQKGWWNCIKVADIDNDGYTDLLTGNLGYNYKYKASDEKPFQVYAKDIDQNGTFDIVLGAYYGDEVYPVRGRSCSSEQLPEIKKKFPSYHEYAISEIGDVYGESLNDALHLTVNQFASTIYYGSAEGFEAKTLPIECQTSPINGIVILDVDNDGKTDIITAGNHYQAEIETGRADAGTGRIVLNKGNREWEALEVYESGLYLDKDLKSMEKIEIDGERYLIAGNNNDFIQLIRILPADKKVASN
ncbi:MAG: VCBS repeat-containing protein [Chitinophagales bacterium]|nr:VCBS repeat-containing protein [Chitinophagales bacterium]